MITFDFPPLGSTGEGPIQNRGIGHRLYWMESAQGWDYFVTLQEDRPAVAFRCHYPGGSAPCDEATAERFIEWVQNTPRAERVVG